MPPSVTQRIVGYGVALLASGAALLLHIWLTALVGLGLPTYITFYPAVMLAATLYGLGPGLLATLGSALLADYFLLPPVGTLRIESAVDLVGNGLFLGMGLFLCLLAERYRRTWDRALRAAETLAVRSKQLRVLTGELALAEQRERQRLGLVLHDGLQQLLVGAKMRATILNKHSDPTVQAASQDLQKLLDESIAASRSLSAELSSPILERGFLPALDWLSRWMQDTHHLTVRLTADPAAEPATDAAQALLFQSVRELLFNVVKHAGVPHATVEVTRQAAHLQIVVADHGHGFALDHLQAAGARGLGLASIRQRLEYLGGTPRHR